MKSYNKKQLIDMLKKEEKNLILFCQQETKRFVIHYLCCRTNCSGVTAEFIYRRIKKYGKL